jgi:protocatechuate 3,4-dioxygenase beta subunit
MLPDMSRDLRRHFLQAALVRMWMLLGWFAAAPAALGQVITTPPPPRSRTERPRILPPVSAPRTIGGLAEAPLHPELAVGKVTGRVRSGGQPVIGASVISVVAELGSLDRMRGPCLSCTSQNSAVCGCGQAAVDLVARLEARADESVVVARTRTDAEGRFEVSLSSKAPALWIDAPPNAPKFVRVWGREKDGLTVDLVPGVITAGVVVDESRDPIAGAIVTWPSPDGRYFDAVTGADGKFELGPFASSLTGVLARRPGFLARWFSLGDRAAQLILMDPRAVQVEVRDARGPAAGIPVELANERCRTSGITGEGGTVELEGLTPGPYVLRAGGDLLGARREVWLGDEAQAVLAPVALRDFAGLQVAVDAPPDPNRYPVSVSVTCPPESQRILQPTDAGLWALGQLPARECQLEAIRDQASTRRWVALVAGQWTKARLVLPASVSWRVPVKVLDSQGKTVDARVEYAGQDGSSGSGGSPLQLFAGRYQVWATDGERLAARVTVTVPVSAPVVVTLQPAAKVQGRVLASTAPVAGASVNLSCPGEGLSGASTTTDEQGRYALRATGFGRCELSAGDGYRRATRRLTVSGNAELAADLSLPASLMTMGRMVERDGGSITQSIELSFTTAEGASTQARAQDGGFSVPLLAGESEVKTNQPGWRVLTSKVRAGDTSARVELTRASAISGQVVDARGLPVTNFEVNQMKVSDPTGHFEVSSEVEEVRLFAQGLGSATLHAGEGGRVVLGPSRVVAVRVVDASGAPVPNAELTIAGDGPAQCKSWGASIPVDADGRGWIEVHPGRKVRASAPGQNFADGAGDFDGGVTSLRLDRGSATLNGLVLREGKPVRGAEVCLEGPGAQFVITRPNGTFSLAGLPSGAYRLTAFQLREGATTSTWAASAKLTLHDGRQAVTLNLSLDR